MGQQEPDSISAHVQECLRFYDIFHFTTLAVTQLSRIEDYNNTDAILYHTTKPRVK